MISFVITVIACIYGAVFGYIFLQTIAFLVFGAFILIMQSIYDAYNSLKTAVSKLNWRRSES